MNNASADEAIETIDKWARPVEISASTRPAARPLSHRRTDRPTDYAALVGRAALLHSEFATVLVPALALFELSRA